jgi:hypothetical protein
VSIAAGLAAAVTGALAALAIAGTPSELPAADVDPAALCTPDLRERFAPAESRGGHTFEVCSSARSIDELTGAGWVSEEAVAADAFAGVDPLVRRALALLYGGRRLNVVRGWRDEGGQRVAVTLVAPQPDVSLRRLIPGTLILRQRLSR